MIKVIELFAGIGSQTQALKDIGIDHKVVGISEIDKYCLISYEALHGKTHNFGNICDIKELPKADLWTYSFPCQDVSIAGKLGGITQGTRSGLLYEVERLLKVAKENKTLPKYLLLENVKNLEELNQALLTYLIKVSSTQLSSEDEAVVSKLHSMLNDFYREVEIAHNMMKYTKSVVSNDLKFSSHVYNQIDQLKEKLSMQYENIVKLYEGNNKAILFVIDDLEEEIDAMRSKMIKQHIERLEKNECSPASSGVFINLVSNLERAGDHLSYIAHTIVE